MMEYIWVAAAALAAFVISLLIGKWLIPVLRRAKLGQTIKEIGPNWHMSKQGTPVMGGLMFIAATVLAGLVGAFARDGKLASVLCVLFLAVSTALIGFLDDYEKLTKKRNLGLTGWQIIVLQMLVTIVFIVLLEVLEISSNTVYLPFFD